MRRPFFCYMSDLTHDEKVQAYNDSMNRYMDSYGENVDYSDAAIGDAYEAAAYQKFNNHFLSHIFNPGQQQQAEFGQQLILQDRLNEYNSAAAQMARGKAAGINPNTLAQGIAGAGSAPSTPAPNSAVGAGAQSLGALASGLDSVANLGNAAVNGIDTMSTLSLRKNKLGNEIMLMAEQIGLTKNEALALGIQLNYMDQKEALGVATMMANLDNIYQQFDLMNDQMSVLRAQVRQIDQDIKTSIAQMNLADAEKLRVDKTTAILELQRLEEDWYKQMRESYGIDFKLPVYQMMIQAHVRGLQGSYDLIRKGVYQYNFDLFAGQYDADAASLFSRSYNQMEGNLKATADNIYNAEIERLKADNDVKLHYANRLAIMEANRERIVGLAHTIYGVDADIKSFLPWLIQAIIKMPTDTFRSFSARVFTDGSEKGLRNDLPN